jgi:hypothetical protein
MPVLVSRADTDDRRLWCHGSQNRRVQRDGTAVMPDLEHSDVTYSALANDPVENRGLGIACEQHGRVVTLRAHHHARLVCGRIDRRVFGRLDV